MTFSRQCDYHCHTIHRDPSSSCNSFSLIVICCELPCNSEVRSPNALSIAFAITVRSRDRSRSCALHVLEFLTLQHLTLERLLLPCLILQNSLHLVLLLLNILKLLLHRPKQLHDRRLIYSSDSLRMSVRTRLRRRMEDVAYVLRCRTLSWPTTSSGSHLRRAEDAALQHQPEAQTSEELSGFGIAEHSVYEEIIAQRMQATLMEFWRGCGVVT